ncbi:MAG: hypothetical protein JXA30_14715 [Deltaproteobacteria bacterium]|nr:hypothetical protein [Deltaproteobacteria bacterium]
MGVGSVATNMVSGWNVVASLIALSLYGLICAAFIWRFQSSNPETQPGILVTLIGLLAAISIALETMDIIQFFIV